MSDPTSEGFESLPPSAKYVLHVLEEHDGELTRQELQAETKLPERTLDHALDACQNGDFLVLARDSEDLRQVVAKAASSRTL